jgi:hypothetical protein
MNSTVNAIDNATTYFSNIQQTILVLTSLSAIIMSSLPKIIELVNKLCSYIYSMTSYCCHWIYRKYKKQNIKPSKISTLIYNAKNSEKYFGPYGFPSSNCLALLWYLNKLDTSQCLMIQSSSLPHLNTKYDIPVTKISKCIEQKDTKNQSIEYTTDLCQINDNNVLIDVSFQSDTDIASLYNNDCRITVTFQSYTKKSCELSDYLKKIVVQYEKNANDDETNIYMLTTLQQGRVFYDKYQVDPSQTFDNIFMNNKDDLMSEINAMKDETHFVKYGLKRKMAYLFVGKPGSGKTSIVSAIANYTRRNIISISLNKVNKASDLINIIYSGMFNGVKIKNEKLIIFFDEFDKADIFDNSSLAMECMIKMIDKETMKTYDQKSKESTDEKNIKPEPPRTDDEKLANCMEFLSILDGIFSQDNLIFIATANSIEKIPAPIYRDGRLKLQYIDYIGRDQIKNMIEKYTDKKIPSKLYNQIRDDKIIQTLTVKNTCLKCIAQHMKINEIIECINKLTVPQLPSKSDICDTNSELSEENSESSAKTIKETNIFETH